MIDWTPLPEDADERRMFDRGTKLMQDDVRLNIANMLRLFAVAHPGGSYADQCRIMANEVAKLDLPDGVPGTFICRKPAIGPACEKQCERCAADGVTPSDGGKQS